MSELAQTTQTLVDPNGERDSRTFSLRVYTATELGAIAEAAGVPEKKILDLNPELRRTVTPPRAYTVKIPGGQSELFSQNWPEVSARSSRFAEPTSSTTRSPLRSFCPCSSTSRATSRASACVELS